MSKMNLDMDILWYIVKLFTSPIWSNRQWHTLLKCKYNWVTARSKSCFWNTINFKWHLPINNVRSQSLSGAYNSLASTCQFLNGTYDMHSGNCWNLRDTCQSISDIFWFLSNTYQVSLSNWQVPLCDLLMPLNILAYHKPLLALQDDPLLVKP